MPIRQEVIDQLWDYADPQGSEQRFRQAGSDPELQTQVARALGLQARFDEAAAVLDAIADDAPATSVRVALEHGRLANSAGDPARAIPYFEDAATRAAAAGLDFLQVDALHMLAIADQVSAAKYTAAALSVADASADARTRRWRVSLHNNLGWTLHDEERYEEALEEFEAALSAAQVDGTENQRHVARWTVARCLRSLGRRSEALAIQEDLLAHGPDDPYVAEEFAALRGPEG